MSQDIRHATAGRPRPVPLLGGLSVLLLAGLLGACSLLSGDEAAPATQAAVQAAPAAPREDPGDDRAADQAVQPAEAVGDAAEGTPEQGGDAASAGELPKGAGDAVIPAAAEGPSPGELGRVSVVYPPDNADLPEPVTAELDKLAEQLTQNRAVRVELHAYAGGDEGQASKAKLYSLKRGMKVRSYLYKAGVEAPRILLRPLGIETSEEPADRVDIILLRDPEAVPQTRVAGGSQFVPAPGSALAGSLTSAGDGGAQPAPDAQPVEPVAEKPLGSLEALGVVRSEPAGTQSAAVPATDPAPAPATDPAPAPATDPAPAPATDEAAAQAAPATTGAPLPQGDAGLAAEDSLTARFEAVAAAEVPLAEAPEQQATIARRGGTVVGTDGDGNVSTSEAQLAELPPAQPSSGGEAAFASHFAPRSAVAQSAAAQSAAAEPALSEPAALPRAAEATTAPSSADPAVSVAQGAEFEAAIAGAGALQSQGELQARSLESAPESALALAALPPADSPTGSAAAPMAAMPDRYLVHFELDSPDMTATGRGSLQEAIAEVLSRPDTRVRIVAHADSQRSDEFLLALSTIRRNEVENALRNAGVPFGRIWSKAVGDRKPLVAGASADNNVVEIVISQRS